VKQALLSQKAKRKAKADEVFEDAHANISTNVLSKQKSDKVIEKGIKGKNWMDFMVSWNVSTQSMARGNTIRIGALESLRYDDVMLMVLARKRAQQLKSVSPSL